MTKKPNDIVRDILDRLHDAFKNGAPVSDPEFWTGMEAEIRAEWGCSEPYVAASTEHITGVLAKRNRKIVTDYFINRISAPALAERWGLSRRMVLKIVKNTPLPPPEV